MIGLPYHGILHPKLLAHQECRCDLPGWWSRWWHEVKEYSCYRCELCGQVYQWLVDRGDDGYGAFADGAWYKATLQDWFELGGKELHTHSY